MAHSAQRLVHAWLPKILALCLVSSAGHAASTGAPVMKTYGNAPDAFLPLPAANVESVLEQIQSDPAVRRHYARYFHMPQNRVGSYLRANLVRGHLTRGGLYTVYYVRPNGLIYPTMLTVPTGTPVFALRDGTPLLTRNEGNPLTRTRKAVHLGTQPKPVLVETAPPPALAEPSPPLQIIVPTQVQTTIVPPLIPSEKQSVPNEPSSTGGLGSAGKNLNKQ